MGLLTRPFLFISFVLGCGRTLHPALPTGAQQDPLQVARARPLPSTLQGKFAFTIRSESNDIAATTGGVVVLDRRTAPPRGHLAVLGPLGGPLATLQTSGGGAAVAIAKERRHLIASHAEDTLRQTTAGALGINDLLGLFIGDLPLDDAPVLESHVREGVYEALLDGPEETTLLVEIDTASAAPRRLIARDADGKVMLDTSYGPFEPKELPSASVPNAQPGSPGMALVLLPTDLHVSLPGVDLDLDVHMKSFTSPDPVPELFGLDAPEGFSTGALEDALRDWTARALEAQGSQRPDTMGGTREGG